MNIIAGEIHINRPPGDVFNYVTTFNTWPKWYPITKGVKGDVEHPCEPGQTCEEYVKIFLIPFTFTWEVEAKNFPESFTFKGTSNAGGGAEINYNFIPQEGGTLFKRELRYYQTNLIMKIADWICIRRYIQRVSDQAVKNAKVELEAMRDK